MTHGRKHLKGRLTLLATLVATSVLIATPVHAGKQLPDVEYVGDVSCDADGMTGATFRTSGGKGRWVFVKTYISADAGSGFGSPSAVGVDGRELRGSEFAPLIPTEEWVRVKWSAELVDRKGEPLTDAQGLHTAESPPLVCS